MVIPLVSEHGWLGLSVTMPHRQEQKKSQLISGSPGIQSWIHALGSRRKIQVKAQGCCPHKDEMEIDYWRTPWVCS
jgi:hypothetical protein